MRLRTGLDDAERRKILLLPGLELRLLSRPARSQSLYDCTKLLTNEKLLSSLDLWQLISQLHKNFLGILQNTTIWRILSLLLWITGKIKAFL
jgi:hypothetical protein